MQIANTKKSDQKTKQMNILNYK